jgi:predicted ATP-grasp superfamily ATP-dependent carboligase
MVKFEPSKPLGGMSDVQVSDVLVLDAGLRQSLVTIRSLGQRGLRVAAVEASAATPAFSSRWCQQKFVCPLEEGTLDYLAYLEQLLEATQARVVISSSDGTVALLRQHRERLRKRVQLTLGPEPALGIAINKEQTLEIAASLGIAIPKGMLVSGLSDVEVALDKIGLPAVIKPVESWVEDAGQRARILSQLVTTPEEARRAVKELTELGGTTLFQQFLTGRREAVNLLYASGQVHARFAQWAKRTNPPLGGSSVLRQSIAVPDDIGSQAEELVREIGLDGYSEVEFRRDSAGVPYLMEINPRLSASVELAVRAGVDFPHLLYRWAKGEQLETVSSYRVGGWMRDLGGDFETTAEAIRQRGRPGVASPGRSIFDFCASFFRPMRYDYLDWKDLAPAWMATAGFGRLLITLVRRNLAGIFGKQSRIDARSELNSVALPQE